ncbi:MAG: hypothetical protein ABIO82_07735 [Ginsengibacter sp.]
MKILNLVLAICLITCLSFDSTAQVLTSSKPSLFTNFSPSIHAAIPELEKAFIAKEGKTIQLNFANNFSFNGTVISSVQRYHNLATIIVKSELLQNTLLTISKRVNEDNSISYVGRIINENYSDGYELKKSTDGSYLFQKINMSDLIQD